MNRSFVAVAAVSLSLLFVGALFAAGLPTPTIKSKNYDGTNYKVVYTGTLHMDATDKAYGGVTGYILNTDDKRQK